MHTEAVDLFAKSPFDISGVVFFLYQTMTISSILFHLFKNNQQHKPSFHGSNCRRVRHAHDLFPLSAFQNTFQKSLQVLLACILHAASIMSVSQCSYISFSVLSQTKSTLVWKSYNQKIGYDFPNQFQFDLEREKFILQDADFKPNSDWFGKF